MLRGSGGGAPDGRRRLCRAVGGDVDGSCESLAFEPRGRDRPATSRSSAGHPRVQRPQVVGGEVLGHRVERVVEAVEAVEHLAVDERRDVLVRLEVAVVDQLDQVASPPSEGSLLKSRATSTAPSRSACAGHGSAGVERG